MRQKLILFAVAVVLGCVIETIPTLLQPHFVAGSIPDLICELILMPGQLIATPFHDRGTASPEFLWRSRLAAVVIFSGVTYWVISHKKNSVDRTNA
jgi:hypothetical protein